MPLSIVATAVAGVAACLFAPSLAAPLLALTGAVILTRVAVKALESYNLDLFIKFNIQMNETDSKYGNLYYMAYAVSILFSTMLPAISLALGIGAGIYKGLIVQIQIQKIKQDNREQETRYHILSPSPWLSLY